MRDHYGGDLNYDDDLGSGAGTTLPPSQSVMDEADAALDAFGGLSPICDSIPGQTQIPEGLDENEIMSTKHLQALVNKLLGTSSEIRLTREQHYALQDDMRLAWDEYNQQHREDRKKSRGDELRTQEWHQGCRTAGQIVFAPVTQAQADRKVPITDQSRISTTTGIDSKKVRPLIIVKSMRYMVLAAVCGTKNGHGITENMIKSNPGIVEDIMRLKSSDGEYELFAGETGVLKVDNGSRLLQSAVVHGDWLVLVRREDICNVTDMRLSSDSAEDFAKFLTRSCGRMLEAFGLGYGLDVKVSCEVTTSRNPAASIAKAISLPELSFHELLGASQAVKEMHAVQAGRRILSYDLETTRPGMSDAEDSVRGHAGGFHFTSVEGDTNAQSQPSQTISEEQDGTGRSFAARQTGFNTSTQGNPPPSEATFPRLSGFESSTALMSEKYDKQTSLSSEAKDAGPKLGLPKAGLTDAANRLDKQLNLQGRAQSVQKDGSKRNGGQSEAERPLAKHPDLDDEHRSKRQKHA